MLKLIRTVALVAVALALTGTDASAGPLKRIKERLDARRSGASCSSGSCSSTAPAQVASGVQTVAYSQPVYRTVGTTSSCANGQCPAPAFGRTIISK